MERIFVTVREVPQLPKLCWLLDFAIDTGNVEILVGSKVERFEGAIVEGCWDGSFDIHELEKKNLFGSAVKWNEDGVMVLGSISLTDRICYVKQDTRIIVSNSFFAIMAIIDAKLDDDVNYYKLSYAPLSGIDSYDIKIPIKQENTDFAHQLFHRNLEISPAGNIKIWCKTSSESFSSYREYQGRLSNVAKRLVENIYSSDRKYSVVPYATLSSGYDSTAVASLARDAGVTQALLCTKPRSRIFDIFGNRFIDDGTEAARSLNLEVRYINLRDFEIDEDEFLYIAPAASTPEITFLPMSKYLEKTGNLGAIFVGHYGDKIWDKNVGEKYVNDQLVRSDMAGINVSEARLKSGFFNVALPFVYARSARSIYEISQMDEMLEWSVGGGYDRPIPRRMAEERGIPRNAFGVKKKAIIDRYPEPINKALAVDYRDFIKQRFETGAYGFLWSKLRYLTSAIVGKKIKFIGIKSRSRHDLSYWMWFWAATKCITEYSSIFRK